MMFSLRSISFCLLVLAAAVLQESQADEAVDISTDAPTQFRCIGICGDEEGELENPDLVVSYQWNSRVPVCAGLSCDNDSCSNLEEKLGLLELTDFECTRHRRNLQDVAGCTCSQPKPRPQMKEDTIPVPKESSGLSRGAIWGIIAGVVALFLLILMGCWLGVKSDDKKEAEKKQEEGEEPETSKV
mmetsp:Transcript_20971/g.52021  ORF Transcript_20971/g.52021 Transcript_20971/m.52021 type:complete len:186 (+) Transcript_20971:96-653(+)